MTIYNESGRLLQVAFKVAPKRLGAGLGFFSRIESPWTAARNWSLSASFVRGSETEWHCVIQCHPSNYKFEYDDGHPSAYAAFIHTVDAVLAAGGLHPEVHDRLIAAQHRLVTDHAESN